MEKINKKEERKSKILTFIKKNPLCVINNISKHADKKQLQHSLSKYYLLELKKEGKINFISISKSKAKTKKPTKSYFILPKRGQENRFLPFTPCPKFNFILDR